MKLLITGGAGFIGSNFLLRFLASDTFSKVTVFDSLTYASDPSLMHFLGSKFSNFEFKHGDICNYAEIESVVSKSSHIIHFAAETHVTRSIADNDIFFKTDVLGSKNLAQAVATNVDRIEKFIHISTSEVYGDAIDDLMDEHHPLNPKSPYAAAKVGADRLVYAFTKTYDIPALIVRPFNQYGPRQHIEKVIPRFITSAILGEPLVVHGDGSSQRDYLHVHDLIDLLKQLILKPIPNSVEVINIGSGTSISILDIATQVANLSDARTPIIFSDDRPGQVERHTANISLIKELFGWTPKINFEDGLSSTFEWYKQSKKFWEPQLWAKKVRIQLPNGKEVDQ